MNVISIFNMKGGVGKTVTAVNFAAILATECAQRVLLIDADAQGNSSNSLLPPGDYNTLDLLLTGRISRPETLIYQSAFHHLDILPADDGLRTPERGDCDLYALRGLMDTLDAAGAYDYVIIDCPPDFPPACIAAIAASDSVIIPLKIDRYAVDGMEQLVAQIDSARKINPGLRVAGCLITCHYRCRAVKFGEQMLRETAVVPVFQTKISRCAQVDESTWKGEPVATYAPRSTAARDYRMFVSEYLAREEAVARGEI